MLMSLDSLITDRSEERERDLIPTRQSLLSRIRHSDDEGWREFFETYWKLIYNTARRYELTDAEAQEVVQETMIGVSKNIPSFQYDPERCSFKTWLMNLILWRVTDQVRKRASFAPLDQVALNVPAQKEFSEHWEQDWERNLASVAIERVKNQVSPQSFQIFSFCVLQKKGITATAQILGVSKPRVYMVKHRVYRRIVIEMNHLRRKAIKQKRSKPI